ncbi:hypothetical protein KAT80_03945 [Candidatus Pacearchaeota archaeon]|nr:hypothetical protein [Candidatus Pacearchaeota archaeon]
MLTKISDKFKVSFPLQFTRELIKNSGKNEFLELETILRKEEKDTHQEIIKKIKEKEKPVLAKEEITKPFPSKIKTKKLQVPVLRIAEPRLPQNFQYLKPTPTKLEIDLGKLNPLIKDPLVNSIECSGTDEPVTVRGKMGIKKTNIILNKEEIDQTIKKFSETAKIPMHEGVLKIAAGRLILSAVISDIIGSKFIIKKMAYSQKEFFGR